MFTPLLLYYAVVNFYRFNKLFLQLLKTEVHETRFILFFSSALNLEGIYAQMKEMP